MTSAGWGSGNEISALRETPASPSPPTTCGPGREVPPGARRNPPLRHLELPASRVVGGQVLLLVGPPASQEFSHSCSWERAEAPNLTQAGIQGWGWGQRGRRQGRWARECPPMPATAGRPAGLVTPEAGLGPAGGGGPHSPPSLREEGSRKHISKPKDLPQRLHCPDWTAPDETAEGTAPREALLVTGEEGAVPALGAPPRDPAFHLLPPCRELTVQPCGPQ